MLFRRLARGLATFGLALACAAEARAGAQALRVRAVEVGSTLEDFIPQRQLLPLTTTSVLIRTTGPIPELHELSCADGVTQLVERLDGIPKITSIPTPSGGSYCEPGDEGGTRKHLLRLSATRALMVQFGPDRLECSDDDGVFLLDDLGGANRVAPISLGSMCDSYIERLSDDTAVVALGPGGGTALLSGLGAAHELAWLPDSGPITVLAPDRLLLSSGAVGPLLFVRLAAGGIEQTPLPAPGEGPPVPLDATRVLVGSRGADAQLHTADDVVYLFRELGPSYERLELPTPYASEIVRLSPTRALVSARGPDGEVATSDDEILLLDHLDGAPTVTPIGVPGLMPSTLVPLGPDLAVVRGRAIVVLRDLGASNVSSSPLLGTLAPDWVADLSTPVRVGPRTAAIALVGPDRGWPSRDDEVALVTATGEGFEVQTVPVPYLWRKGVIPLPPTGALVASFGPGIDPGYPRDDTLFAIGGLPGAPSLRRRKALNVAGYSSFLGQPVLLGNGRAVVQNWVPLDGSNDRPHHLQVIRGLDGGVRLHVRRISIGPVPGGQMRLAASVNLFLPEPERFASSDLAVRVGNATQTIPCEAFEATGTGFRYLDPSGARGFLRRVEYDSGAGRLEIEGHGTGTGAETTTARNLVLSLESLDLYAAESLDGTKRGRGIVYRRP